MCSSQGHSRSILIPVANQSGWYMDIGPTSEELPVEDESRMRFKIELMHYHKARVRREQLIEDTSTRNTRNDCAFELMSGTALMVYKAV